MLYVCLYIYIYIERERENERAYSHGLDLGPACPGPEAEDPPITCLNHTIYSLDFNEYYRFPYYNLIFYIEGPPIICLNHTTVSFQNLMCVFAA